MYAGQNKEVQEVIKKACTRKMAVEFLNATDVAPAADQSDQQVYIVGEDKSDPGERGKVGWRLHMRMKLVKFGRFCRRVLVRQKKIEHSNDICDCASPECEGTGV